MAATTVTRYLAGVLAAVCLVGCTVASASTPLAPVDAPIATAAARATPGASPEPVVPIVTPAPLPTGAPTPPPAGTPAATARPTPMPTPPPTPSAAKYCEVADVMTPSTEFDEYAETYLDWTYRLPAGYVPPDLVNAVTGAPAAGAPLVVRAVAYDGLARLRAAALAAGHRLTIVSAYRSSEQQAQTFDYWTQVGGYQQALGTSARAGHSEHQLGTAIDFGDGTAVPWAYADWAATPAGAWLAAHAAEFGFVMSYPKGRTAVTCYAYEPWHYRYVGTALAEELLASGLSLREFQSVSGSRD